MVTDLYLLLLDCSIYWLVATMCNWPFCLGLGRLHLLWVFWFSSISNSFQGESASTRPELIHLAVIKLSDSSEGRYIILINNIVSSVTLSLCWAVLVVQRIFCWFLICISVRRQNWEKGENSRSAAGLYIWYCNYDKYDWMIEYSPP